MMLRVVPRIACSVPSPAATARASCRSYKKRIGRPMRILPRPMSTGAAMPMRAACRAWM